MKTAKNPEPRVRGTTTLHLTPEIIEVIRTIAKREHRSITAQIEYVLDRWIEQQRRQPLHEEQ
jgi:hypothetical protein